MSAFNERAHRVATALCDAVADTLNEQNASISPRFFIDSNVAIHAILGFRDEGMLAPDTDFAISLLRIGQVELEVLPPHALEVANNIRSFFRGSAEDDGAELAAFLSRHGAVDLSKQIDVHARAPDRRLDAMLRFVTKSGRAAFVAIERASGSVKQRFAEIPISFFNDSQSLRGVLEEETTRWVFDQLSETRPESRDQNRADAMCWAWLLRLATSMGRTVEAGTARSLEEEGLRSVIFYSTDLRLRRAVSELRQNAVRVADEFYILARATLPGLTLARRSVGGEPLPTRQARLQAEELEPVRSALLEWTGGRLSAEQLANVSTPWGDATLADVIHGLQELYFIQDRWNRWSEIPPNVIERLHGPRDNTETREVRIQISKRLEVAISDRMAELHRSVEPLRKMTQRLARMRSCLADRKRAIPKDTLIDPMKDLGLVRWGVLLSRERQEELSDTIRELLGPDTLRADLSLMRIAGRASAIRSEEECLEVAAYLWFLTMYDVVTEVIETMLRCSVSSDPSMLRVPLRVMSRAAAQFTDEAVDDVDAVLGELQALRDEVEAGLAHHHGAPYLGLGYLAYKAWRRLVSLDTKVYGSTGSLDRLAQVAYRCGRDGAASIRPGTLAWAFAINHCAYVGTCVGIRDEDVEDWIEKLEQIHGLYPAHWHFRFDDTLAYRWFMRGRQLWEAAGRPRGDAARAMPGHKDWYYSFQTAAENWKRMAFELGEGETRQHLMEAKRVMGLAGCVELESYELPVLGRN